MQKITVFFLSVCSVLFALSAYADEPFYVELGSAKSQEEAANRWEDLQKSYHDQLGGLQFYPVVIPETQQRISLRILAGPIESKEDAQKICRVLFRKKAQCFVVEGMESPEKVAKRKALEEAEAKANAKAKENAKPLPWLVQAQQKPSEPKEKPGFWGSLFGSDESAENEPEPQESILISEPVDLTPKEAKVEVAEAIAVPRRDSASDIRTIFSDDNTGASEAAPLAAEVKIETVGWLNVEKFDTEDNAGAFWQNVRGKNAPLAAGLRVRINKPLMARSDNNVTLNIGPFGSQQDANQFCEQAIKPIDAMLSCKFTQNEPKNYAATAQRKSLPENNYQQRRQKILSQRQENTQTAELPKLQIPTYWVALATAASQSEALDALEKIKSDNSDLLGNLPSRIAASFGSKGGYTLKIGPMQSDADAYSLCERFKDRGTACRVLSNK